MDAIRRRVAPPAGGWGSGGWGKMGLHSARAERRVGDEPLELGVPEVISDETGAIRRSSLLRVD